MRKIILVWLTGHIVIAAMLAAVFIPLFLFTNGIVPESQAWLLGIVLFVLELIVFPIFTPNEIPENCFLASGIALMGDTVMFIITYTAFCLWQIVIF